MNILSAIRAGFADLEAAASKIEGWAEALYAKLPPALQGIIDAEVVAAKKAAANADVDADTVLKGVIDAGAAEVNTTFLSALEGAGYSIGGAGGAAVAAAAGKLVQPYEIATVDRIRDALKGELDVGALAFKASMASSSATSQVTLPSAAPAAAAPAPAPAPAPAVPQTAA